MKAFAFEKLEKKKHKNKNKKKRSKSFKGCQQIAS